MKDEDFDIILSKNRLARNLKDMFNELNESIPEHILFYFDEIEKKTGVGNQPTARDILTSKMDI
jgi:hypothetical protein